MILIAIDCDGTLDSSDGPIPVSRLYELNIPPHIQTVIVSASPFCDPRASVSSVQSVFYRYFVNYASSFIMPKNAVYDTKGCDIL